MHKKLDKISEQVLENKKEISKNTSKIDEVIIRLVNMEQNQENFVTITMFNEFKDELFSKMDHFINKYEYHDLEGHDGRISALEAL